MHENASNLKRAVKCNTVNRKSPLSSHIKTTGMDLPQKGRKYCTPLPVKTTRFP